MKEPESKEPVKRQARRAVSPRRPATSDERPATRRDRKAVLIADDDPGIRFVVGRAIERLGCRVLEVEDGAEVPDAVSREPFQLLVLDLYMPGMNGFEVLRQLRHPPAGLLPAPRTPADVRVLILSSESNAASVEHARAAGADDYLTKPFDIDELSERVLELLR